MLYLGGIMMDIEKDVLCGGIKAKEMPEAVKKALTERKEKERKRREKSKAI